MKKIAVVLFNLGGPLTQADVKPFLYNLFSDKYIIGLPFGMRQAVAKLISTRREKPAQANYALMGGGSPIVAQTEAQAEALGQYLSQTINGLEFKLFIAMRYWHPFTEDTAKAVEAWGADKVIALPLYPQFSTTTTLSSFATFKKAYQGSAPVTYVCCYPTNAAFVKAQIDLIEAAIAGIKNLKDYKLLFSAHGLPESVIKKGDSYQAQVEQTVAAVMAGLGDRLDHVICYQSRVGPMKWIGPSTDTTITETVKSGKSPIIVPIAFVSEHIETLVELDVEYQELAHHAGAADYVRVPAVGVAPFFIRGLADEVVRAIGSEAGPVSETSCAACHSWCPKRKGF